ncbi:GNAT family N-acetyltransferase [Myxococcota bacterium]|nr:GNAT family N-acetyltransferase [Myxococcota bacterium]
MSTPPAPFDPERLAAFAARVTAGEVTAARARDLMTNLVAGPHAVRVLGGPAGVSAVGVLVDTCANAADAAELSVFAEASAGPQATRALVPWALSLAAQGPRTRLDVALYRGGADREALADAGFLPAYTLHTMRAAPLPAEGSAASASISPLPGFTWRPLAPDLVAALHETTALAFADVPGAFMPTLEMYRARCEAFPDAIRALLTDGERVAAFVRCEIDGAAGEIASLGRHPDFRGAGLGPVTLAKGIELLRAAGAREATLEVAASNERALCIYEAAGFVRCGSLDIVRRAVRAD